jgi:uncharacterized DUF497 family protein
MATTPFQWDNANRQHIAAHDVTTSEAEEVFYNAPLEFEMQDRNGEQRQVIIGPTFAKRILYLVWTLRDGMIRVVTAFSASRKHRQLYEETMRDA